MIRPATLADVPRLVEMGVSLRREPVLRDHLQENPTALEAVAHSLVTGEASDLLVAERDGGVVGMLGLLAYSHPMSGQRVASEIAFWVDPAHRGAGVALLRAGEAWARAHECPEMEMGSPNERVDRLYERLGYVAVERRYRKMVGDDEVGRVA
jgi:GNAT superfamily N-acetyltransferase